jgi:hypothetical protein
MTIKVHRHASRSGSPTYFEAGVFVEHGRACIGFSDRSKYTLLIEPTNYAVLVKAMLRANPEEAIKAFAIGLKDGIPAPVGKEGWWHPVHDKPKAA